MSRLSRFRLTNNGMNSAAVSSGKGHRLCCFRRIPMKQRLCCIHPLECLIELGLNLVKLFLGSHCPQQVIVTLTLTGVQLITKLGDTSIADRVYVMSIGEITAQHFHALTLLLDLTLQRITLLPHRVKLIVEPL